MLITNGVHNNLTVAITLPIPGYDANHAPVVVPASSSLTLLGNITPDQLEAIQPTLHLLIADGSLSQTSTVDTTTFIV
jgi:hypothetical protein